MAEHKTEHKKHETKHEVHKDTKHDAHSKKPTHHATHATHHAAVHAPHRNKHRTTHPSTGAKQLTIKFTKKKKPKFNVLNAGFMKSVKERWRKPRGTHNKKRMRFSWAGASPRIGYRNPPSIRNLHPSGKHEILIHNIDELQAASGKLVRIAAQVGRRKRIMIEAKAKELGLVIINLTRSVPDENKMVKQ